ncbi:MAG: hypothetical protein C4524_03850 [Candidatus Zixiibacteriota bacterium]|nr:MAG: hypothetical protein C4524_03850 [candidate division Zixibacteria bacterium]
MPFQELTAQYGIYAVTFLVCLASGVVPVLNAEAYLIFASAVSPPAAILPLILLATMGQMSAKAALYTTGLGVVKLPLRNHAERMERVRRKFERWKGRTNTFVFLSALTGFPPFYTVSMLAGAIRISFNRFMVFGFVGRFLRFAACVLGPQIVAWWMK